MQYAKSLTFVLLLAAALASLAETRYVTDQFKITLRSGESSTHRIVRMIPTGEPLTVLRSNPDTGYTRVRTQDGKKGYVLTHQIVNEPIARDQLVALQGRVRELETAPGELSAKLAALQGEHAQLQQAYEELQNIKQKVGSELTNLRRTSSNAVQIANERNELRRQVARLSSEFEELKQENRELRVNSNQRWFLIGGGVVTGGILLGLVLPHLRMRRRRDSWGSL